MIMEYVPGRENFAATIFVPYDCHNNCPFCTTKALYKGLVPTMEVEKELKEYLANIEKSSIIKDVVFTGGEPMVDLEMLERLIKLVPSKDVYINTSLLKEGFFDFVKLVNKTSQIKGVNVSRHETNPSLEPKHQVEDWCLEAFEKPIRINAVIPTSFPDKDSNSFIEFVENILARWQSYPVTVNFREDYRFITPENLHVLTKGNVDTLVKNFFFESHSFCDVCDTVRFFNPMTSKYFQYHRGLQSSSIDLRSKTIINDLILLPQMKTTKDKDDNTIKEMGYILCYDWDFKEDKSLADILFDNNGKKKRITKSPPSPTPKTKGPIMSPVRGSASSINTTSIGGSCGGYSGFGGC